MLLRHGSVYYVNYPRRGFSSELIIAQLADLAGELASRHGRPPAVMAISFGAGLVLEWLRRSAALGRSPALAGIVLVSPVACVDDLLDPSALKPTTLLGRALRPYLEATNPADDRLVEKSRTLFLKMFEAGAKNKAELNQLLAPAEARMLRDRVLGAINSIDARGAIERVQALHTLPAPGAPVILHRAPTLILFSEKENAVLCATSPTTRELIGRPTAWFPAGCTATVRNTPGNPVQHASLIFHSPCFAPLLAEFYRSLRSVRRQVA
jgi:alpha-beta hydrolase superfamily lysophospholipase